MTDDTLARVITTLGRIQGVAGISNLDGQCTITVVDKDAKQRLEKSIQYLKGEYEKSDEGSEESEEEDISDVFEDIEDRLQDIDLDKITIKVS